MQLFRIRKPGQGEKQSYISPHESSEVAHEISKSAVLQNDLDQTVSPNQRTYQDIVAEALELMERDPKTAVDIRDAIERNTPAVEKAGIDRLLRRENPFKPGMRAEVDRHPNLGRPGNNYGPSRSHNKVDYPFETNTWNQPLAKLTQRSNSVDHKRVRYYIVKKFKPHQTHLITTTEPAEAATQPANYLGDSYARQGASRSPGHLKPRHPGTAANTTGTPEPPTRPGVTSSRRQQQANARRLEKLRKSRQNDRTI